jgi:3-methyladenine DNA glycosylase AlkD
LSAVAIDIPAEVAAITAALAARCDPAYEAGMRRTVPSMQPAHATRVPEVRRVASEWRREHKNATVAETLVLCESLWATGWREERLVAIALLNTKRMLDVVDWPRLEAWSESIDNWEQVDHLSDVTGKLLAARPALFIRVNALDESANPWQRRLALVTLIVAFRQDAAWRDELSAMAERLSKDPHALVRRAVVWARDRLKKDHIGG